jgi:hypothetical protein
MPARPIAPRRRFLLSSLASSVAPPLLLALAGCSVPSPGVAATGRMLVVDIVDRESGEVLDLYTHAGRVTRSA